MVRWGENTSVQVLHAVWPRCRLLLKQHPRFDSTGNRESAEDTASYLSKSLTLRAPSLKAAQQSWYTLTSSPLKQHHLTISPHDTSPRLSTRTSTLSSCSVRSSCARTAPRTHRDCQAATRMDDSADLDHGRRTERRTHTIESKSVR